jgi:hypothetical protein
MLRSTGKRLDRHRVRDRGEGNGGGEGRDVIDVVVAVAVVVVVVAAVVVGLVVLVLVLALIGQGWSGGSTLDRGHGTVEGVLIVNGGQIARRVWAQIVDQVTGIELIKRKDLEKGTIKGTSENMSRRGIRIC